MTTEHPILFSPLMVKANLAGLKTATRRIIGTRNTLVDGRHIRTRKWEECYFNFPTAERNGATLSVPSKIFDNGNWELQPIYKPGDWLWVREGFGKVCKKRFCCATYPCKDEEPEMGYEYLADSMAEAPGGWADVKKKDRPEYARWYPGIHLPKVASRIWHQVLLTYPQRIQDITEEDARAEGMEIFDNDPRLGPETLRNRFNLLWNELHPGSWIRNDWVWVTEYRILSTMGKPLFKNLDHVHTA